MTPSTSNNANLESFTSDNILSAPAADNCRTVPTPITTSSPLLNDKNQTLEPSLDVDVIATSPVNCASMQPSNNNKPFQKMYQCTDLAVGHRRHFGPPLPTARYCL
ncbi:unnamed protein product [Adineta ricciae]|uniref:Uncharacterized protein n=1 Tax=Adineta ricciae TaxID=249248 RepID=A0A815XDQ1_ADIRI|nr:unnamed protein product [Adineta ricciae]